MVGKIAFLFPGQGSQCVGMGKLVAEKSSSAKALIAKADQILGYSLSALMFEGPEEKLRETDVAQPALFVASVAALELMKQRGIKPDWVAGHSLGEYSALYAAGVLSFENALTLVQERGRAMNEAGKSHPGTMAAILGMDFNKLVAICKDVSNTNGVCVPANFNSESQIVISGSTEGVKKAMETSLAAGAAKAIQLNVAGAFHSPLMTSAALKMKSLIAHTHFNDSPIGVLTNVDATPTFSSADFKRKLVEQIDHAVLWDQTLKELIKLGAETFFEVGSGRALSGMVKKLDRKKTVLSTDDVESIDKSIGAFSEK